MKKLILPAALLSFLSPAQGAVLINEVRIDDASTDTDEYFELSGDPGESLDGLSYIVIGDGSGGSGTIERVIDLTGQSIGISGYYLAANNTLGTDVSFSGTIDLTLASNTFENSDNVTHLLVSGFSAADGDDLDADDDGVLDFTPWILLVDGFSLVESVGSGDLYYGASLGLPEIGPDGSFVPAQVYRIDDGTDWAIGDFGGENDTPGAANIPEPSIAIFGTLGLIGLLRRRR